jgi:hypothetical protein
MLSTKGHQASEAAMPPGIRYTYRFEDYLAAARARAGYGIFGRHSYQVRYSIYAALFLAIVGVQVVLEYLTTKGSPDLRIPGLTLACFAAVMITMWLLEWTIVRLAYRRLAMADADVFMKFEADGVHWSMSHFSGAVAWSGIRDIVSTPKRIFLFVSKSEALTLPRRAFASDDAFGEILQFVQTKTAAEAAS